MSEQKKVELLRSQFDGETLAISVDDIRHGPDAGPWTILRSWPLNERVMPSAPVDMVLFCPECGTQHVDAPEPEKDWDNPPHRSHLCAWCKCVWRPADIPTNGVATVQTRGSKDSWPKKRGR